MKNAMGLHRSKEFMKANPSHAPKVHHLRVTPMEHGGVKITHHASASAPAFATHSFGAGEHEEAMDHVAKHGGIDMAEAEPEMEPETPGAKEEGEDTEERD